MAKTPQQPDDQNFWNGPAGQAWIACQQLLDRMLQPFETLLVDHVARLNVASRETANA